MVGQSASQGWIKAGGCMIRTPKCPLRYETEYMRDCILSECAWYQTNNKRCSIWVIANSMAKGLVDE